MVNYGHLCVIEQKILSFDDEKYVQAFDCGNKIINKYFQKKAANDRTAVTYLFIDKNEDTLIACITLACSAIFTEEDDVRSTVLSAMEVKYFAVDKQYQHMPYLENETKTLSDVLFDHMINLMDTMSHDNIGASKIVLYSVKRAVNFYRKHGFKYFGSMMYGDTGSYVSNCEPMYFDLNT